VPIALHGGGEFLPGDEPFLDALLDAAPSAQGAPIRIVLVPTAAARGRPDLAAANGVAAFRARASATGRSVQADVARVVDAASADDDGLAALIDAADLVDLPGGDPDLIPSLLPGTAAGATLGRAVERDAVLAGASAGAMAFAEWTWTPDGGVRGLGFVPGLAVFPHYDESRRRAWQRALARISPVGIGHLGLDERTGVIGTNGEWQVSGEGAAYWFPSGSASEPVVVPAGERLRLRRTAQP
jgi:cyanophycinase-like exopeptidase